MSTSQKVFAIAWLALVAVSLWGSGRPEFAGTDPLGLPPDFQHWSSMSTNASDAFYHEMYVNASNVRARTIGGVYPDGTKLVLALYDVNRTGKSVSRGKLLKYEVMTKDGQLFSKTGGWGFADLTPDGKREPVNSAKDCWSCHSSQSRTDHTYSLPLLEQGWVPARQ